jgi:hypothetical protein
MVQAIVPEFVTYPQVLHALGTCRVFLALLGALSSGCRAVAVLSVRAFNGTPVDAQPLMPAMAIPTPLQRSSRDFISGSPLPHQSV